jgi:hypothetical protein
MPSEMKQRDTAAFAATVAILVLAVATGVIVLLIPIGLFAIVMAAYPGLRR